MQIIKEIMDKKQLRKKLLKKRIDLDPLDKIQRDSNLYNNLINTEEILSSRLIITYVSTKIEADTKRLIGWALRIGKSVGVPITHSDFMTFHLINGLDALKKSSFGILEPEYTEKSLITDFDKSVCIVPALAYNHDGYRLGYGGGYYDRFLKGYKGFKIGICYNDFICEIPVDKHDVAVDKIITN